MHVYSSNADNSQKVETTQMSISEEMDNQIVVKTYEGILCSHKKEALIHATTWINPKNNVKERSQAQRLYIV